MGSHISVTFPPETVVNFTPKVTHPVPHTPIFTHLHSFFVKSLHFLLLCPFLSFHSDHFMLSVPCLFLCPVSLSFPTLCRFALQLITFLARLFLHICLPKQLSASFVLTCLFLMFSPHITPQLALSPLLSTVSTCFYLDLLLAMTPASHLGQFCLSVLVSPCPLPLSLYFPQQLCFVLQPADKAADKGEWEHI